MKTIEEARAEFSALMVPSAEKLRAAMMVAGFDLLETAIEFVRENLAPQTVYDEEQLDEWAQMRGYTKEE